MAGLRLLYSSVSLSNACARFQWALISRILGCMRRRSRVANDRRSTCTAAATALMNSSPTSTAAKELFLIDANRTLLAALAACPICFLFTLPAFKRNYCRVMGCVGREEAGRGGWLRRLLKLPDCAAHRTRYSSGLGLADVVRNV